ncbi:MAG: DUF1156 domain-containing protein, partial [Chloroflexia bacterium]|nr:DUF1156 domain-containing protein [Chloroflexia bacterium]
GKPVPLSPNWWLQKGNNPVAVVLICEPDQPSCQFKVVLGNEALASKPDDGTIRRGVAVSPWTSDTIDGDYIKREAQAGRMGHQLYALGIQTSNGKSFRTPTKEDLEAISEVELKMQQLLSKWQAENIIPFEEIDISNYDRGHRLYGVYYWHQMFSPRQLYSLGVIVEELRLVINDLQQVLPLDQARTIQTYLGLALDKAVDRNSIMTRWIPQRQVIANTFDKHNFAMQWSYAEFDAAHNLVPWVVEQITDSYKDITKLASHKSANLHLWDNAAPSSFLHISSSSAASLINIADQSIHLVVTDPPYYDNVMYAELSDFFYVWLKRTVGDLYPEWFQSELTDKDDEAVANFARFAEFGPKKKKLAEQDYERKMAASFREMHRVLRDDGVLTVMFTHKRVEAWDTLASALIGAGFRIEASWPVHTESKHSLHQAKKNAAASTILLVCRKRTSSGEPVWWDDIKGRVRRVAREKAKAFAAQGISGVDLYISAFGPALSVISEAWPVLTSEMDTKGQPVPLRPEVALDLAREEVIGLRKEGLLLGRQVQFDPATDWYLMAWDAFKAEEFPADEARKLALALGLDLEQDIIRTKRLVAKKQSTVVLLTPKLRRKRDMVDPDVEVFTSQVDAVHTAMLIYEEDGPHACQQFLKSRGLLNDGGFRACIQAMLNAIPRTKIKDAFARPEADTLERLRLAFFEDLVAPAEETPPQVVQQLGLLGGDEDEGEDGEEEEES